MFHTVRQCPVYALMLAPNLQAHVERFVQSIQHDALDHFIVFGEEHFDHLVSQYVEHYHTERPHQAKGNEPVVDVQLDHSQNLHRRRRWYAPETENRTLAA